MLCRKHFEFIARNVATRIKDEESRKVTAEILAHVLRGTNPRFDEQKFISACGVVHEN